MPGLLDLHTDNRENHYQPRPNVYWDPIAAAVNHDGEISVSGVTTAFDALCLGLTGKGELRAEPLGPLVEGIAGARAACMLRADHRIHQIGNARRREQGGPYEANSVVAVQLKKKNKHNTQ